MSYPADPYWANVKNLLHFDGVNGGKRMPDEKNGQVTVASTAVLSSAQKKFGNTSLYCDGLATGNANVYTSAQWASKEVTVEAWMYPLEQLTSAPVLLMLSSSATFYIRVSGTNTPNKVTLTIGGSFQITSASDVAYNAWSHIAVTRTAAGDISLFINGVLEASGNSTFDPNTTSTFSVGGQGVAANAFRGYISDFRYTLGVNRYPTNFTPPTAAFPGSGVVDPYYDKVQAHLHFNGENGSTEFVDQKGHTFARQQGTAGQVPTIGVSSSAKFGMSWGDFSANSKGIKATSSDFVLGSSDFTLEFFSYVGSYDAYPNMSLVHAVASDGTTDAIHVTQTPYSGELKVSVLGTQVISGFGASVGALNHIALVRSGGNLRLYANGVQTGTTYNIGTTEITGNGALGIGRTQFGRMDEFRITIGVARYVSNFTPTTEPFPDAGPQFLSGTVLDYDNAPLARTVRCFRRSDSLLTDTVISNATTGAYELRATDMSEHYVVVFDDARNAMVYDHIAPVV